MKLAIVTLAATLAVSTSAFAMTTPAQQINQRDLADGTMTSIGQMGVSSKNLSISGLNARDRADYAGNPPTLYSFRSTKPSPFDVNSNQFNR